MEKKEKTELKAKQPKKNIFKSMRIYGKLI